VHINECNTDDEAFLRAGCRRVLVGGSNTDEEDKINYTDDNATSEPRILFKNDDQIDKQTTCTQKITSDPNNNLDRTPDITRKRNHKEPFESVISNESHLHLGVSSENFVQALNY